MTELDVVALLRDYPEFGLRAGAFGTIVHEHVKIDGRARAFMVEFPGPNVPYDSIVETIEAGHLRLATDAELADMRARNVAAE